MTDLIVNLDVTLPLKKQKQNKLSGYCSIPVSVRSLDDVEARNLLHVASVQTDQYHTVTDYSVFEFEGKLWRTEIPQRHIHRGDPNPVSIIAAMKHELTRIPRQYSRGYRDDVDRTDVGLLDTSVLPSIEAQLAQAAQDILVVGTNVYRTCHEPTWLVSRDKRVGSNLVSVQPSLVKPQGGNFAWFSADSLDQALAVAQTIAGEIGGEVERSGQIEVGQFFRREFDDQLYAQNNLVEIYHKSLRSIAGTSDSEEMDQLLQTSLRIKTNRSLQASLDLVFQAQEYLTTNLAEDRAVEALLAATRLMSVQVSQHLANPDLSIVDEDALDQMKF